MKTITSQIPRELHTLPKEIQQRNSRPPIHDGSSNPKLSRQIKQITPITSVKRSTGGQAEKRKNMNYMGSKTNRSILMEFNDEVSVKSKRQSKLYDNAQWIPDEDSRATAGSFFGHSMAPIDNTTVYRVLLQNPNGIIPNPDNYHFQLGLSTCYDHCVAHISLTETNLEWRNKTNHSNLRVSLKKWWDGTAFQTSTSSIPFTSNYKPGGTVSIVCGNHWVARIIEKGEDESGMGRWTYIGLRGNQSTKILHITWYLVCNQSSETAGEKTAFMQQEIILREKFPHQQINPRRQSVLDMQWFITTKLREGYWVILSTDGNENLSANKKGFCPVESTTMHAFNKDHDGSILTLANSCGLVDILQLQHKQSNYPATYIRGKKRIDGIFISYQIVHAVLRTGLTPFHTFFQGDHRAAYVDFSASLLFNSNTYELTRQKGRGLQLKDPRIVDAYLQALFDQLEYHKVQEKLDRLIMIEVGNWSEDDTRTYVKLDTIITEAMVHAERSCARRYSTHFQWSPLLLQAVYAYRYARLKLKEYKGIPVTQKALYYHQQKAAIPEDKHEELNAIEKIVAFMRESKKKMKEMQLRHIELRKEYVEGLAEALVLKRFPTAESGTCFFDEQKEKQLKALSNRESARTMHCKIRAALGNNNGGGTTRVDIPDPTDLYSPAGVPHGDPEDPKKWKGSWLAITEPEEMLQHIRDANIKQYHQAHDTPFAQEPLFSFFGPDGTTQFAQEFLQGRRLPEEIFSQLRPETQRILNAYQLPPKQTYKKETLITPSMFISCYKNVDEKTSSSVPSERHVGKYKAALESPTLVQMYTGMMNLPYLHGFTFERWRKCVDVVLPKDEGEFKIHRFRIIRLVESDFNQSLGMLLARPLGHFMEDASEYPEMQYGSRDGQMTLSAVLNKVLTFDIVRLSKIVMATEENDAIGCYDRIVQQKVSLYLQRMGIALALITCVCRTFDETKHYIKTAHGLSKEFYESTKDVPLFGAGQGTTVGPFFWLLIFSIMLEAFDPKLKGMTFASPCGSIRTARYGDAFVDDTKFGVTAEQPEGYFDPTREATLAQVQQVLTDLTQLSQHYEKLLYTSGGALNIKKCHWVMMAWRWVHGKAYLMTSKECPGNLFLTSGSSTSLEEVPRLEPNDSYRTLGVHIAVDGNMKKALKLSRQKSEVYAGLLMNSSLTGSEAYFSFVLYFFPKISYSLPLTTFSQKECRFIQAPAMSAFLPKIGLNRSTSRSIICGPASHGGLQVKDVYTEQGIGQLRLLIGHLRKGDQTSKLLLVAMSIMQLRVGSKVLFMNLPYPKYYGWVERTWLTSVWQFLHIANMKINIPGVPLPTEQRENDTFLMSEFIYQGFKKGELELINQCRLYYQVIMVADVAVADGTMIDSQYERPVRNLDRVSYLQWPVQNCPSPKAWATWRRALNFLQYKGKLINTLGQWKTRPHQRWNWIVRLRDMVLFYRSEEGWERLHPLTPRSMSTRSTTKPWYDRTMKRRSHPPDGEVAVATPSSSEMDGDLFTICWSPALPQKRSEQLEELSSLVTTENSGSATDESGIELPNLLPNFMCGIQSSIYFSRLVGPIQSPDEADLIEIITNIQEGTLLVCSDGSFHPHSGTGSHAWLFATPAGQILLQGAGPVDCHPKQLSSYRPELGGITSLLYLLTVIVKIGAVFTGSVTLYCDNQSALDNVFNSTFKRGIYPLLAVDYDLLILAKDMLQALPVRVVGAWVKGHYKGDDRRVQHNLNDLVDTLATQFRETPPAGYEPSTKPLFHHALSAALYKDGSMVTGKIPVIIYERLFQETLIQTIQKRANWTKDVFNRVDWDVFGKVFHSYSRFYQTSIAKFVHGLWNTGEQKVRFNQDQEGLCPCCKREYETIAHVFRCQAAVVVEARKTQLEQLADYLDKQDISKPIKQCMYAGIDGWIQSDIDKPSLHAPTRGKLMPAEQMATQAFVDQTVIGWDAFLRGQLSQYWRKAILLTSPTRDEDATETHLRRIIKKLHSFSLLVWACRNGILHGETRDAQREIRSALIRNKVAEAYELYFSQKLSVLARDSKLFHRKTLEERLKGDDDMLFCWLRAVEVAIGAFEKQQANAIKYSSVFFQPFREMGRRRLLERRMEAAFTSQKVETQDIQESLDPISSGKTQWSQREEEHLEKDVSESTRQLYSTRRQRVPAIEGFNDTVIDKVFGVAELSWRAAASVNEVDSIISPGPFCELPIMEQQFSSDSSYTLSQRRDVAHIYDTLTSSSDTWGTPEGYGEARRQNQIARMDQLIATLDKTIHVPVDSVSVETVSSVSSEGLESGTTVDGQPQRTKVRRTDTSRQDYCATTFPGSASGSSDTSQQDTWQGDDLSIRQLLRFPLHRIADASTSREWLPPALHVEAQLGSNHSASKTTMANSSESINSSDLPGISSPLERNLSRPLVNIEELSIESSRETAGRISNHDPYYLQLAQDDYSVMSNMASGPGTPNTGEFREKVESIREERLPTVPSDSPASSSDIISFGDGEGSDDRNDSTTSSGRNILEILSPLSNAEASSQVGNNSEESADQIWRSSSIQPPTSINTTGTHERASQGAIQGLSLAPLDYWLQMQLHVEPDTYSIPESLPSLTSGAPSLPDASQDSSSIQSEVATSEVIGGAANDSVSFQIDDIPSEGSSIRSSRYSQGFDGNTMASTSSYISEVEVVFGMEDGVPQVVGFEEEIPDRELDDPPDQEDVIAASLSSGEIE